VPCAGQNGALHRGHSAVSKLQAWKVTEVYTVESFHAPLAASTRTRENLAGDHALQITRELDHVHGPSMGEPSISRNASIAKWDRPGGWRTLSFCDLNQLLTEGAPSLNRSLIQGWDTANLNRHLPGGSTGGWRALAWLKNRKTGYGRVSGVTRRVSSEWSRSNRIGLRSGGGIDCQNSSATVRRTVEVRALPPFARKKRRMGHPPVVGYARERHPP
jgi:hypothetical protein